MSCNIIFDAIIYNNTIKQYLEYTAISPHLSGPIMLQITVKCFNLQITIAYL